MDNSKIITNKGIYNKVTKGQFRWIDPWIEVCPSPTLSTILTQMLYSLMIWIRKLAKWDRVATQDSWIGPQSHRLGIYPMQQQNPLKILTLFERMSQSSTLILVTQIMCLVISRQIISQSNVIRQLPISKKLKRTIRRQLIGHLPPSINHLPWTRFQRRLTRLLN